MSTSTLLYSIQRNLYRIAGPILIVVGTVSCTLNLMVFTKNTLRKNPCAMCFIGVNIINFVLLCLGILLTALLAGYDIDPTTSSIVFCRFRYYISTVLTYLETSYIILASIDRTLVTSANAGTRRLSTRRLITACMISLALFWMLFHIPALIFTQILQYGPNYFVCYYQPGSYTIFMTYSLAVLNGCLPLLLMAIFGCWTVKNVRQVGRTRQHPGSTNTVLTVVGRQHTLQPKDRQLIRMLLVDMIAFITFKCPVTMFLIYQQITQYNEKSAEQQIVEQSVVELAGFVYFIESCISCYTNILVSKTFRTELKGILLNIRRRCLRQRN